MAKKSFSEFLEPAKEWIEMLKNLNTMSQKAETILKKKDPKWYLSDEGKAAYEAADTPAKKTRYFFDFLMTKKLNTVKEEEATDVLFKTALIMNCAMDKTSLEYGSYPDILDEGKNPLLKDVFTMTSKTFGTLNSSPELLSIFHLSSLHGKETSAYMGNKGYLNLSFCKDGEECSDLYKLERAIIGICCSDNDMLDPYDRYSLSFGGDDEEEEESEEED